MGMTKCGDRARRNVSKHNGTKPCVNDLSCSSFLARINVSMTQNLVSKKLSMILSCSSVLARRTVSMTLQTHVPICKVAIAVMWCARLYVSNTGQLHSAAHRFRYWPAR